MKTISLLPLYMLLPALLMMLGACDVHEFPDEPDELPTLAKIVLSLRHEKTLGFHKLVNYGRAETTSQVRHTIRLFAADAVRSGTSSFGRLPLMEKIIVRSETEGLDWTGEIELSSGEYAIMVWTDHIGATGNADHHYSTSDFADVRLRTAGNHPANTDTRDAFCGTYVFSTVDGERQEVTVDLERPLAKFRFIANDLKDFNTRIDGTADLSGYYARLIYAGYMPCAYNLFTGRPSDSATGVYFDTPLEAISDTEVDLGFDYVFINHTEGKVMVVVQIIAPNGETVAQTNALEVPLMRSKVTEVRGKFLTATAKGGIGIDSGFDGDYNIVIRN